MTRASSDNPLEYLRHINVFSCLILVSAPAPPRRDPQTSLSYSKATSKSMAEGLAEIGKLAYLHKLNQYIIDQQSCSL